MNIRSALLFGAIALFCCGCVERMITINSAPSGAVVWLNDEEIGATPVTTHFTWYGTYDVILRKEGYETIHQPRTANAPLYQWPPLDLFFETLWPFKMTDHHLWDFRLETTASTDPNELIERANDLRQQVLMQN